MRPLANAYSYENQSVAIIGYGVTGKACVAFLLNKGAKVSVFDDSFNTSNKQSLANTENLTFCEVHEALDLREFDQVVVSPGVNLRKAFIQNYIAHKGHASAVIGDIELFARQLNEINSGLVPGENPIKVVAVTGSNGKSTVVDMLTKVLLKQGVNVALGGNFGTAALALIAPNFILAGNNGHSEQNTSAPRIDIIVLELSSFQLESTFSLCPDIGCILNISSDHLDRHGSMAAYTLAKQQIYANAATVVFNRDDSATSPSSLENAISVGYNQFDGGQLGDSTKHFYQTSKGIYCGQHFLFDASQVMGISQFQLVNMQVVFACCQILKVNLVLAAQSLGEYKGLPHRFETVYHSKTSIWINDSKATNPGACLAALESLAKQVSHIILIAGGDAKGADIQMLAHAMSTHVDRLILIGKDADLFTQFGTPFTRANSIEDAVEKAKAYAGELARNHDNPYIGVMLSPACASIDMFNNYQHRGQLFCQAVTAQVTA
ncbi:UDP-N-acetylmuramoylalanine--D-glutamate ligase [Glaciecola punicea ACAM 611]|jgi:UDP-N-acetylmuramoylalanine--D-glutamate ligase|uniref:UDP-N-acetylmuramoylalanine--D-glutamate ligase n=1 Tax=Glaciecola punicea ACAM 611 TaxID=1121923 RepID=H5TDL2_9ALTE|nr:UDP-N-acetylmuramoyl-L-alanine--D-glutamate ligase [Glaciecola punicea]OFA32425.1 UDP-N-acetylmuramoylalanine--D-glutamate ligase [Glaciecola punicea]GAB56389.1 UDP-N-acetylmuramoylalanine--D-glutamate ligase [Glaciecola punicea ACAM 611]